MKRLVETSRRKENVVFGKAKYSRTCTQSGEKDPRPPNCVEAHGPRPSLPMSASSPPSVPDESICIVYLKS